ncbi:hypothetical protein [Pseudonocardia parietis]|uniref:Outer membrane murein-binding lipoprotein Lpp n=1 Tax=Pseudonocardia parietis TaxID=570936 RepID=A0ABS4W686_9PSEU|nr:hypothetical protein [Pseudonocardia parietis]MBP2371716.1 outer membrane murein-binding lipoprotein Lpp [Pseudonocardia parietis]
MSSSEVERRLRQQGADVDSLYEISSRIEDKVDTLDSRVGALDTKVDALDSRVGALDTKVDQLTETTNARFDGLERTLAQILERLDRD